MGVDRSRRSCDATTSRSNGKDMGHDDTDSGDNVEGSQEATAGTARTTDLL
jgi:hypothetical protein